MAVVNLSILSLDKAAFSQTLGTSASPHFKRAVRPRRHTAGRVRGPRNLLRAKQVCGAPPRRTTNAACTR